MSLSRETVSRDPDGLDPSDDYYSSQLEPDGALSGEQPDTIYEQDEPPEDADYHGQQEPPDYRDDATPTKGMESCLVDWTKLVGIPPPPPPTAPPPKKGTRGVVKTPASSSKSIKGVSSFKENEETSSFDKEDIASNENNNVHVTVPPSPAEASTTSSKSNNGPLKDRTIPFKASDSLKKAQNIMERRRKMALSTYESEIMVLDENTETSTTTSNAVMKQEHMMISSKEHMAAALSPREVPLSPTVRTGHTRSFQRQLVESPSSVATKTHSNQTPNDVPTPKALEKPLIPPRTFIAVDESKVDASEKRMLPSPKAQTTAAKDERLTKRGFSLERRKHNRSQSPRQAKSSAEAGKKQKKRGLLKKLFRGRRGRDRQPVATAAMPVSQEEPRFEMAEARAADFEGPSSIATLPQSRVVLMEKAVDDDEPLNVTFVNLATSTPKSTAPLKPALKSPEERHYHTLIVEEMAESISMTNETIEMSEIPVLVQHEETVANLSTPSSPESVPRIHAVFSQDPPDDEHGDPPMHVGPPLLSPTKKHLQVEPTTEEDEETLTESVRSRIAEVYKEHLHPLHEIDHTIDGYPASIPNEQSSTSEEHHDEVSILTGPSFESLHKKKSSDPSPKSQTGYTNEFFNDDKAPALRVEIQELSMEPAGASPTILESTRVDEEERRYVFGDPVGSSPAACQEIHAPSNDPLGMSPFNAGEMAKSPKERALSLLNDEDRIVMMHLDKDIGDPMFMDGYLSDDSGVDKAKIRSESMHGSDKSEEKNKGEGDTTAGEDKNACITAARLNAGVECGHDLLLEEKNKVVEKTSCPAYASNEKSSNWKHTTSEVVSNEKNPASQIKERKDPVSIWTSQTQVSPCVQEKAINDIEKSGFEAMTNTPTAGKKTLTVSAAAFTNAKAVAYFHQLQGEPSPRHSWHVAKTKKSDTGTTSSKKPFMLKQMKRFNSSKKMKGTPASLKKKAPSPNDYSAEKINFETILKRDTESTPKSSQSKAATESNQHTQAKKQYVSNDPNKMFAAYSRFQGRRPNQKSTSKPETPTSNRSAMFLPETSAHNAKNSRKESLALIVPLGKITGMAVSRGVELRRLKREKAIENGLTQRVVLTPREKPRGINRFKMIRAPCDDDIKDPIKRAGRRLLSKAAVPIQAAARRYLAKQEALDRMWAIIQVQSYIRRWRSEANFQAHIHSAVIIQKVARRWLAGKSLQKAHLSATLIQKIVRGYLAAIHAYDAIYYVCRIQAVARRFLVRSEIKKKTEAAAVLQAFYAKVQDRKNEAATEIQRVYRGYKIFKALNGHPHVVGLQTLFRGFKARKEYSTARLSACNLQKHWRSYSACMAFQMDIADIITAQSVVRRWSALRMVDIIRYSVHSDAVTSIQSVWRAYSAQTKYRKYKAATCIQTACRAHVARTQFQRYNAAKKIQSIYRAHAAQSEFQKHMSARKIQATWRGFQAYTDYIFLIVDVLVVQRKIRQWLAIKKVNNVRREKAALDIQRTWRMRKAQVNLLYSLVHIIMVQSVARRYLSKGIIAERKVEYEKALAACKKKEDAATTIQKAWRGFWACSHFIIVRYETTRIQALMRRQLAKRQCNLRLGCVILIQATARRCLAKKVITGMAVEQVLIASRAEELRERNSAKRLQFWWRIVLDWNKEKKAALTIERFFIFVKDEVDREIRRREMKRLAKEKKRRECRRQSEDNLLEKVWSNTVDETLAASSASSVDNSRPKPSLRTNKGGIPQVAVTSFKGINPKLHLGGFNDPPAFFHEYTADMQSVSISRPPTEAVQLAPSQDFSIVSNITNPSVFHKMSQQQHLKSTQTDTTEEIDFEFNQSFHKEVRPRSTKNEKKHRLSTEDYIRKYGSGMQTAPNRLSQSESSDHFFTEPGLKRQASTGTHTTVAQTHTQASTPVSYAGHGHLKRRHSSGSCMSISIGATTAQGHHDSSPLVPSTPRSTTGSRSGSTPRGFSSRRENSSPRLPPVTPTSRQKGHHISRRATSETESQTTMSNTIYSRQSPRRHSGGIHSRGGKNPVMIMKTYPDLEDGQSVQGEAHEVLLLGDEYGEV
jgi:hypothetical protein